MSVKRVKVTDGVFTHTRLEVDLTRPEAGDRAAIDTILRAAAPTSRIQALKLFADTLEADNKLAALVSIRLKALRAAITEAETAEGRERLALIGKADLMRREIEALPYTRAGMQTKENLDAGRPEGVKSRRDASQEKLAKLRTIVEDLLRKDKNMTAEQLRDHMHAPHRNLSPFSPASTLKHVKTFSAQIKKKR